MNVVEGSGVYELEDQMRLCVIAKTVAKCGNSSADIRRIREIEKCLLDIASSVRRCFALSREFSASAEIVRRRRTLLLKRGVNMELFRRIDREYQGAARAALATLSDVCSQWDSPDPSLQSVVCELSSKEVAVGKNFGIFVASIANSTLPAIESALAEDRWPQIPSIKQKKNKDEKTVLWTDASSVHNFLTGSFLGRLVLFYRLTTASAMSIEEQVRAELASYYGIYLLVAGFVFLFFGERLAKPVLFTAGFLAGSLSTFFLSVDTLGLNATISIIVGAVCGLIASICAIKLWKFSLFVIGGLMGAALWISVRLVIGTVSGELLYGLAAALVLAGGLIAVQVEVWWIRLSTPLIGTVCLMQGIGNLFPFPFDVVELANTELSCEWDECYSTYSLLILLPILGYLYQYWDRRRRRKKRDGNRSREEAPVPPAYMANG